MGVMGKLWTAYVLAMVLAGATQLAHGAGYGVKMLVADQTGAAPNTDPNLINAWGVSFSPTGPFWVANNGSGTSTVYNSTGVPQGITVTIPPASGRGNGRPTGTAFNGTTGFVVTNGSNSGPAMFLFDTEDGTISGWNPSVNATQALIAVNNGSRGDNYKGMEIAKNGTATFMYVADFFNAQVRVLDTNFQEVSLAGSFTDPNLPAGYAPYNLRKIGTRLFVLFAKQNAKKSEAVVGAGLGLLDVFDLNGNFIRRLTTGGQLNAPWGIAQAPTTFGTFGGDILVGNLGDGRITAFDPQTGASKGQLSNSGGKPIVISELWALTFGNGGQGGKKGLLYFTSGPGNYKHGRLGSIAPLP